MFKSIRFKLYILFISVILVMVALTLLMNTLLLPQYYFARREEVLRETYVELASAIQNNSTDDFAYFAGTLESKNAIRIIIFDQYFSTVYGRNNTNMLFQGSALSRYPGFGSDTDIPDIDTDSTLMEVREDKKTGLEYLSLFGTIRYNGEYYYIWVDTTIEAINDSVKISNTFLIFTALCVFVFGSVALYFVSSKFVRPIVSVNNATKKMAVLDFSKKITVSGHDEVGELGRNINLLSSQLETTITDLQTANQQLKLDLINREKADQMRKEFLSNVSHELKTPIALIMGYAEGLKVGINEEDRDFYCDVITDEAQKMSKMVSRLLYTSQIDSDAMKPDMSRFELNAVVEECIEKLRIQFMDKGITVEKHLDYDGEMCADLDQIRQVITNFCTNAINHCNDGKLVRISTSLADNRIHFSVYNTGEHIGEEHIAHIWESFYKVDKARTREYGGTGLGLYIVRRIVENHNGTYGVNNVEGGVEFWFELEAV